MRVNFALSTDSIYQKQLQKTKIKQSLSNPEPLYYSSNSDNNYVAKQK